MSRHPALGSDGWRSAFERKLKTRARLAKLTQWRSVAVGAPVFLDGNHAFYLHDGERHLEWMLAAIGHAKKRVDLEIYIFEPDTVGTKIRDALVAAAARGVTVRLLYDAVGGANAGPAFFQPILDAGGAVTEFNPVAPWRLRISRIGRRQDWSPNNRDHRKILVCDSSAAWGDLTKSPEFDAEGPPPTPPDGADRTEVALAITGGRNIGDVYMGFPLGHGQWRDCGAVIFGPASVRIGALFDAMWDHAAGKDMKRPSLASLEMGELPILPLGSQPGFLNLLGYAIWHLAAHVQEELRISCAYFIPGGRLRRALARIARVEQGCKLILPLHNDLPMVAAASRHFLGRLLRAGVQIFLYAAETLHEKTFVYDRRVTVLGSSNLDQRSFRLNYELSVVVIGEAFAAPIVKFHERDIGDSQRYTLQEWKTRPLWEKFTDWFWSLFRSQL
ncbi:MAG: phospholipase D-like domain-containing protein [Polyangiaceae bacterium]